MFKSFRDKIALSGLTVLSVGVALLIFTFISAYGLLTQNLNIIATADLVQTFGESLAPLIATCIRLMYLGVMGWVASLMTIRGVTIITHTPQLPPEISQQQPMEEPKPQPQKTKDEKKEPEPKPEEPEIVVIPTESIAEPQHSES
jgi:hypothetical protein